MGLKFNKIWSITSWVRSPSSLCTFVFPNMWDRATYYFTLQSSTLWHVNKVVIFTSVFVMIVSSDTWHDSDRSTINLSAETVSVLYHIAFYTIHYKTSQISFSMADYLELPLRINILKTFYTYGGNSNANGYLYIVGNKLVASWSSGPKKETKS